MPRWFRVDLLNRFIDCWQPSLIKATVNAGDALASRGLWSCNRSIAHKAYRAMRWTLCEVPKMPRGATTKWQVWNGCEHSFIHSAQPRQSRCHLRNWGTSTCHRRPSARRHSGTCSHRRRRNPFVPGSPSYRASCQALAWLLSLLMTATRGLHEPSPTTPTGLSRCASEHPCS
jgi:hypothetical protein